MTGTGRNWKDFVSFTPRFLSTKKLLNILNRTCYPREGSWTVQVSEGLVTFCPLRYVTRNDHNSSFSPLFLRYSCVSFPSHVDILQGHEIKSLTFFLARIARGSSSGFNRRGGSTLVVVRTIKHVFRSSPLRYPVVPAEIDTDTLAIARQDSIL